MSGVTWLRLIFALAGLVLAGLPGAAAERLRIATYNTGLSRDGPGVLLHDLGREAEAELSAVVAVIQSVRPDVLLLAKFDHDLRGHALAAFLDLLREGPDGIDYPHSFHAPVNAGVPSGLDLDGDSRTMGWEDAHGYGKFPGDGGMAVISRLPLDGGRARTFRTLLWSDLPGAGLPKRPDGGPFPSAQAQAAFRLSSRSHWDVPVLLPGGGRLHLLASNPTPPLFDGEEGRNRLRNHDEIMFWAQYLDGGVFLDDQGREAGPPDAPLAVLGDLNLDPADGAGLKGAIDTLLAHPALQDPQPDSRGAVSAARAQAGANAGHSGSHALDTADWRDEAGPGNLRVDFILPSAGLNVAGAGVFWPAPEEPLGALVAEGPPHRLVWVDLVLP